MTEGRSPGSLNLRADFGNSGTEDTQLSDAASGVLYGVFAIAGFFAGSVNVGG